jgi:hypothetical protein
MREYSSLFQDGIINLRVAVAERQAPYARFQIEIFSAVSVVQVAALALDNIRQYQRMFITPEYVIHVS